MIRIYFQDESPEWTGDTAHRYWGECSFLECVEESELECTLKEYEDNGIAWSATRSGEDEILLIKEYEKEEE